jgi:hypothetical protein
MFEIHYNVCDLFIAFHCFSGCGAPISFVLDFNYKWLHAGLLDNTIIFLNDEKYNGSHMGSVQLLNYCNSVRILKWLREISSVSAMLIYVA